MIDLTTWMMEAMEPVTGEVYHLMNRSKKVVYPYITFIDSTTPADEIRDIHRVTLNLFDYGSSRARLMALEEAIRTQFDRQKFVEWDKIIHTRRGLAMDVPTGDDTIQRRDVELIIKLDRRYING